MQRYDKGKEEFDEIDLNSGEQNSKRSNRKSLDAPSARNRVVKRSREEKHKAADESEILAQRILRARNRFKSDKEFSDLKKLTELNKDKALSVIQDNPTLNNWFCNTADGFISLCTHIPRLADYLFMSNKIQISANFKTAAAILEFSKLDLRFGISRFFKANQYEGVVELAVLANLIELSKNDLSTAREIVYRYPDIILQQLDTCEVILELARRAPKLAAYIMQQKVEHLARKFIDARSIIALAANSDYAAEQVIHYYQLNINALFHSVELLRALNNASKYVFMILAGYIDSNLLALYENKKTNSPSETHPHLGEMEKLPGCLRHYIAEINDNMSFEAAKALYMFWNGKAWIHGLVSGYHNSWIYGFDWRDHKVYVQTGTFRFKYNDHESQLFKQRVRQFLETYAFVCNVSEDGLVMSFTSTNPTRVFQIDKYPHGCGFSFTVHDCNNRAQFLSGFHAKPEPYRQNKVSHDIIPWPNHQHGYQNANLYKMFGESKSKVILSDVAMQAINEGLVTLEQASHAKNSNELRRLFSDKTLNELRNKEYTVEEFFGFHKKPEKKVEARQLHAQDNQLMCMSAVKNRLRK